MPELPEVERARKRLERLAKGRRISKVLVNEDSIVFSGVTHAAFATACEGRVIRDVRRLGKNFYLVFDSGPHPIFHFGMSGTAIVKGEAGPVYCAPRAKTDACTWPPKYSKVVFTFADAETGEEVGEWAFCDARRLGRLKLADAQEPETVAPLSTLGADPLLAMPIVEVLASLLQKRKAPIKAVLLDQNGPLCGIGNWMVDEILYQARLHPSHPSNLLTLEEITTLHHHIRDVTVTAVNVDADAKLFPSHWLFFSRWGKGKKDGKEFVLPSGEKTTITFVTVGGRTSAVIEALQKLPEGIVVKKKATPVKGKGKGKRKAKEETDGEEGVESEPEVKSEEDDEEEKPTPEPAKATSPYFKKRAKVESAGPPPLSPSFKLPMDISPTKSRSSRSRGM